MEARERPIGMERPDSRSFAVRNQRPILGVVGIILVLVAWQVAANVGMVDIRFASSPTDVARAGFDYVQTAHFRSDIAVTGLDFVFGFALGVIVGIVLGLVMGSYLKIEHLLEYVVSFAYSAPRVALIPLIIVWFGIGSKASIAMVFLMTVFPVLVNTLSGISTVDHNLLEMAASMNVRGWRLFKTVVLPGSVPSIMSGIRLAVGTGLVGVIVAEFTASTQGLGYMVTDAAANYETSLVFVGVVIVSLLGIILTQLARRLERRFDRWRPQRR